MYDPWADRSAYALQVGAVCEDSIDERAIRVSWCGMHGHASGLIHDQQVAVFEDYVKINVLWQKVAFLRLRYVQDYLLSLLNLSGWLR